MTKVYVAILSALVLGGCATIEKKARKGVSDEVISIISEYKGRYADAPCDAKERYFDALSVEIRKRIEK